jgi:hypothetical protein
MAGGAMTQERPPTPAPGHEIRISGDKSALKLVWSTALLFFAISVGCYAANRYHYERFTGNPQYSSGRYWYSFFTGVYEREIRLSTAFASNGGGNSMNSNWFIFPAEETQRLNISSGSAPFWTPTIDQVEALESLLPNYLRLHPPIDDKPAGNVFESGRQYFGVTKSHRKLIYLNAFCNPSKFNSRWKQEIILVKDGGSCYFQVYFDPGKNEFIHLHYNGNA